MRIHAVLAGIFLVVLSLVASTAPAQSTLQTKVFTGSPEGYYVTSTLIYGDKDAILVDPQFLSSEAHKAAAIFWRARRISPPCTARTDIRIITSALRS